MEWFISDRRIIGLVVSLVVLGFVFWQYRNRRFRRGDMLIGTMIALSLMLVSAYPPIVNGLAELLQAESRPIALAITGNIVLFVLFVYILKEVAEARQSVGDLVRALARLEYEKLHGFDLHPGIMVIIPAFNEERNLEQLLPRMPTTICGKPVQALVIVDGSQDRSASVAHSYGIPVAVHPINRGGGDAVRTGFDLATQKGAEVVVTMDADGQHQPEEIERLVKPILDDEADIVMGSRFLGYYAERGSARHVGIVGFAAMLSMLLGIRITDSTSGFRAIRASELARLELRESQFTVAETIIEAVMKGLRYKEVPVTILARHDGKSKKPRSWRYPVGFALVILRTWLRS